MTGGTFQKRNSHANKVPIVMPAEQFALIKSVSVRAKQSLLALKQGVQILRFFFSEHVIFAALVVCGRIPLMNKRKPILVAADH